MALLYLENRLTAVRVIEASVESRPSILKGNPHAPAIRSLAVIPLTDLSNDREQQYFSDGLTDELISALARSTTARVISRASSMQMRGSHRSSREIAAALGVDALVEGSVLQVEERLHVSLHLVDARSDRDLWAETYDVPVSASLAVVSRISQDLSIHVTGELDTGASRSVLPAVNIKAYDSYLRGRFEWNKRDTASIGKALTLMRHSI